MGSRKLTDMEATRKAVRKMVHIQFQRMLFIVLMNIRWTWGYRKNKASCYPTREVWNGIAVRIFCRLVDLHAAHQMFRILSLGSSTVINSKFRKNQIPMYQKWLSAASQMAPSHWLKMAAFLPTLAFHRPYTASSERDSRRTNLGIQPLLHRRNSIHYMVLSYPIVCWCACVTYFY